jgi:hypothetical protein
MGMTDQEIDDLDLQPGKTLVRTDPNLHGTGGFLISDKYQKNRKADTEGILWGYVAGHGGDVWWVVHQFDAEGQPVEATVAVYGFREFTAIANLDNIEPGTDFLEKSDD